MQRGKRLFQSVRFLYQWPGLLPSPVSITIGGQIRESLGNLFQSLERFLAQPIRFVPLGHREQLITNLIFQFLPTGDRQVKTLFFSLWLEDFVRLIDQPTFDRIEVRHPGTSGEQNFAQISTSSRDLVSPFS